MGPGTFIAQILAIAGGDNIFADATMNWTTVSLEQVVRRDPDVVVLPVGERPPPPRTACAPNPDGESSARSGGDAWYRSKPTW